VARQRMLKVTGEYEKTLTTGLIGIVVVDVVVA
jgi:hypothetical protein